MMLDQMLLLCIFMLGLTLANSFLATHPLKLSQASRYGYGVRVHYKIPVSNPLCMRIDQKGERSDIEEPYLKHACKSCAYIYDEEKGFKKRFPAGTRFKDLKTFACPVCGAAKDQFEVVKETK